LQVHQRWSALDLCGHKKHNKAAGISAWLRGSPVLLVPALLPLGLLIFLIRVRFPNALKKMSMPRAAQVYRLAT